MKWVIDSGGDSTLQKSLVRSSILIVIVVYIVAGLAWQYISNRIEQSTFNKLNSGLYQAMIFTERNSKRTYQPHGHYYYTNLYAPANYARVKSYLTNYIKSHDSSVELKSLLFRMPDSNNLIGLATVGVHVLPEVTVNVELNNGSPLMHFTHPNGFWEVIFPMKNRFIEKLFI